MYLCFCCLHQQKRHLQVTLFLLHIFNLQKHLLCKRTHYKFTIAVCKLRQSREFLPVLLDIAFFPLILLLREGRVINPEEPAIKVALCA